MLIESDTLIGIIMSFRICCTKDDSSSTKSRYKASLKNKEALTYLEAILTFGTKQSMIEISPRKLQKA